MPRPTEYDNLTKTRALEAVQPTPGAVARFLKIRRAFLALADRLSTHRCLPRGDATFG
jgi:hypothetical protein